MRALQMPRPGKLPTWTLTPQAENMPVAGDTFAACVCFQQEKLGLGIFYLRAVTDSSGHSAMDTPTSEIEGAAHLTVHGQFMPLERYASAGLHVWHDRRHSRAISFPGTSVQFIRLQVNEDSKWYAPTSQLDALAEWCAQTAPQKVPPLKCEPYEGLFMTDRGDKGLTTDLSRSLQCKICEATVPRICMHTPLGLSNLGLLRALGSATRRGGTKPNVSFIRSAPAETPPPPPQRGNFSRTSKRKSIHFFF